MESVCGFYSKQTVDVNMKTFIAVSLFCVSLSCGAGYTANHTSKVSWVKIYNSNTIYFRLESMPTDHQCANDYFVLTPSLTENQIDRYYSMLLAAKTSQSTVSVGYDKNSPDCYSNRPVAQALTYN